MKKQKKTNFWNLAKFDVSEFPLLDAMEKTINNRPLFILLYVLDSDLVIYEICKRIREEKIKIENVDDSNLEDVIGPMVHKLFGQMFITQHELKSLMAFLKQEIILALANNRNQQITDGKISHRW